MPCLKYTLSEGLGVRIVLDGGVMKIPQILLVLNASSARSLQLPSYILETLSYGIALAYSVCNHVPFSTYSGNLVLSLSNVGITFLVILYAPYAAPSHLVKEQQGSRHDHRNDRNGVCAPARPDG